MSGTKKIGAAGKYGVRYGRSIRTGILKTHAERHAPHRCPSCRKIALRREAAGIWSCKKCATTFAGKAYKPF